MGILKAVLGAGIDLLSDVLVSGTREAVSLPYGAWLEVTERYL